MDGWEVLGLLFPDYSFVNLPAMGANPLRMDIFVQYDYERGAHVGPDAWPFAINLFREHHINLWVTENERPRTAVESDHYAEHVHVHLDGAGHYYLRPETELDSPLYLQPTLRRSQRRLALRYRRCQYRR